MRAVFSKSIAKAAEVIKSGGLVICPSEGVYGISCSVFNEDAVKKVIAAKERDVSKGLIIVDSSLSLLSGYIDDKRVDDSAHKNSHMFLHHEPQIQKEYKQCQLLRLR